MLSLRRERRGSPGTLWERELTAGMNGQHVKTINSKTPGGGEKIDCLDKETKLLLLSI